jgi:hypothetical protein
MHRRRWSAVALGLSALAVLTAVHQFLDREQEPPMPQSVSFQELQSAADFSILQASYLPPGCELQGQYPLPRTREVFMAYTCLGISQQRGDDALTGDPQHPVEEAWPLPPRRTLGTAWPGMTRNDAA